MPYSLSSPAIRHWQGYVPGWPEVVAGLALFSPFFYMVLTALLPLFTASVLLLDAAPAVPNVAIGGIVTVAIAVVGWLLNRTISGFDTATKETKEAVHALTQLVTEMRLERKDDRQLTVYLKERQDKLEHENEVLRNSVAAFDRHIAIQTELKKQQSS